MNGKKTSKYIRGPPCPVCGHTMNKTPAYIDQEIKSNQLYATISFNIVTAWVCRTCMQMVKK